MVLSSSGAFAASDSHHGIRPASSAKGNGLLSGILSPVANVVDKTVSQVPVVRDITGTNTVANLVAPVTAVTDRVETTVNSVPVVGQAIAPVRNVTNSVVPPVVNVVGAVATPVLGAVDQVTAPVLQIVAPVLDPVTGAVKPVVEVSQAVMPAGFPTSWTRFAARSPGYRLIRACRGPGQMCPGFPAPGIEPGVDVPGPARSRSTAPVQVDSRPGQAAGADAPAGRKPAGAAGSRRKPLPGSSHVGTLAEYLAIAPRDIHGRWRPSSSAALPSPTGGAGHAACGTRLRRFRCGAVCPCCELQPGLGVLVGYGIRRLRRVCRLRSRP